MTWKKKTIDVSSEMSENLVKLSREFSFSQETHAYQFCFSVAVAKGLSKPKVAYGKKTTKWARGNFDDGSFDALFTALHPVNSDFSQILEDTAEAGIEYVLECIDRGEDELGDIIRLSQSSN